MKQVVVRKGRVFTADVPPPAIGPGLVRVLTRASCISPGTEAMGIAASGKSLVRRAIEQPDKAMKAFRDMKRTGVLQVLGQAREKFDGEETTGYSAAGVVDEVGEGVSDIQPGDRVAVAGASYALHAAELAVPVNLTTRIPDGVSFVQAGTVALGAIALQAVRRAQVGLGEVVVVLGCGGLGLLAVQMLRAAGCRTLAMDPNPDRRRLAADGGAELTVSPDQPDAVRVVRHFTGGHGADAVIVTAATPSNEPLRLAFEMCRVRGRTVLVGAVGREFDRDLMYAKELDFVISTSYGPGRYDASYERWGLDYPFGHVRWTERRNMEAYLRLLARGDVRVDALIGKVFPVEQAEQAYALLAEQGVVLAAIEYPAEAKSPAAERPPVAMPSGVSRGATGGTMGMAIVGAGSFVRTVHAPNIRDLPDRFRVRAVVNQSGVSARRAADLFGECRAETDPGAALKASDIDGVLIGTRHHLHAAQAVQAIGAGKAVYLEKPMCLTPEECDDLGRALEQGSAPFMVGYNRRFAPLAQTLRTDLANRINPVMIHYTMNAGYLPYDHWTQTAEGGGRIVGEACHLFDLFRFLIGAPVAAVSVDAIRPRTDRVRAADNCVTTLTYTDGSTATLLYTAIGHPSCPKERLEVFCDEQAWVLDDYRALQFYGARRRTVDLKRPDKGHRAALEAFHRAWVDGTRFPIPWAELRETWAVTWQVAQEIAHGRGAAPKDGGANTGVNAEGVSPA